MEREKITIKEESKHILPDEEENAELVDMDKPELIQAKREVSNIMLPVWITRFGEEYLIFEGNKWINYNFCSSEKMVRRPGE